jgi:hypothetical protein
MQVTLTAWLPGGMRLLRAQMAELGSRSGPRLYEARPEVTVFCSDPVEGVKRGRGSSSSSSSSSGGGGGDGSSGWVPGGGGGSGADSSSDSKGGRNGAGGPGREQNEGGECRAPSKHVNIQVEVRFADGKGGVSRSALQPSGLACSVVGVAQQRCRLVPATELLPLNRGWVEALLGTINAPVLVHR